VTRAIDGMNPGIYLSEPGTSVEWALEHMDQGKKYWTRHLHVIPYVRSNQNENMLLLTEG
jgi:hypothetical protein